MFNLPVYPRRSSKALFVIADENVGWTPTAGTIWISGVGGLHECLKNIRFPFNSELFHTNKNHFFQIYISMGRIENIILKETKKYNISAVIKKNGDYLEGYSDKLGRIWIPDISRLKEEEDQLYSLGIFFHEVGHIHLNHFRRQNCNVSYLEEYQASRFAIKKLKEYKLYKKSFSLYAIQYVIKKMAQAYNKGHNLNDIPDEIIKWTGIDIKKWKNAKKISVSVEKQIKSKKDIIITLLYENGVKKTIKNE